MVKGSIYNFSSQPLNSIVRLGSVFGNAAGIAGGCAAIAKRSRLPKITVKVEEERERSEGRRDTFFIPTMLRGAKSVTKRQAKHKNALAF